MFDQHNPNLALWMREMPTDAKLYDKPVTKPFKKGGGFAGTAINATYVMMRLTQAFGPVGFGWGYSASFKDVEVTAKLSEGGTKTTLTNFCHLRFWYFPEKRDPNLFAADPRELPGCAQFEHVGGTEYTGRGDDDCWKKSLTDAITKAASLIGIVSDVHLGFWDDNKYAADQAVASETNQRAGAAKADAVDLAKLTTKVRTLVEDLGTITTQEAFAACRADALALRPQLIAAKLAELEQTMGAAVKAAAGRLGATTAKAAA